METSLSLGIISTCLLFICVCSSIPNYQFKHISTNDNLETFGLYQNVRSSVGCAVLCAENRQDDSENSTMCEGYSYELQNLTCHLYTGVINTTSTSGKWVYKYNIFDQDPDDGFEYISTGGQTFVYYFSDVHMNYDDARSHCLSQGAYLAHIDSLLEYDALEVFLDKHATTSNEYYYIGANDLDIEGVWVCDRHGTPLDFSTWRFMQGEPNNYHNSEDCGVVRHNDDMLLNDIPCSMVIGFACERTP